MLVGVRPRLRPWSPLSPCTYAQGLAAIAENVRTACVYEDFVLKSFNRVEKLFRNNHDRHHLLVYSFDKDHNEPTYDAGYPALCAPPWPDPGGPPAPRMPARACPISAARALAWWHRCRPRDRRGRMRVVRRQRRWAQATSTMMRSASCRHGERAP